uniref:hypothetical protein n=1 Tax=Pseudomonas fluorescens TaxID=294 RepID=UPI0018675808|nr:hypothetical protein [Pseudomonas fluorescens]
MKKKQITPRAIIGLGFLASILVTAFALQNALSPGTRESKISDASVGLNPSFSGIAFDRWSKLDDFKKGLPALLSASQANPEKFVITDLARQLAGIRVGEFPVCADEEISADQYIQLSEITKKLDGHSNATSQINKLLDTPAGITDCQFRILDGATVSTAATTLGH